MSTKRMSDTTPSAPDISRLTADELKAQGWQFEDENTGNCIECKTYIVVSTYWHKDYGFASVRSGCSH